MDIIITQVTTFLPKAKKWLEDRFSLPTAKGGTFWGAYRHGLLHQASFQPSVKSVQFSSKCDKPVHYDDEKKQFIFNPVKFYEDVTSFLVIPENFVHYQNAPSNLPEIKADTSSFSQSESSEYPKPIILKTGIFTE